MKKIILMFSALLLAGTIFAQQKAYVSLGVGAGLGTARTYDLYDWGNKVHPVGLGTGLDFNLRGGYFVGQAIAIELGVGYRMGFNTKVDLEEGTDSYNSSNGSGTLKFKSDMLYLVPAVVISPDFESKTRPYARLGVLIGIMPSITTKWDITTTSYPYDAPASDNTVATIKYSGGVAFGGSFALGCDFNLSDLLAIYAEIYYDALSYAPSKGEFKKCEVNGKDVLPDMTTYDKEVEFVKDLTGFVPKDSEPDQQLKNSYPLNSLGLNIGLKIKL